MRILLIEDDRKISDFIVRGLREEQMVVDAAYDADEGVYMAGLHPYDLFIVDWMLPGKSGPELIRALRAQGIVTPILMLTARDSIDDRVTGLESGADDYLGKPFAFAELVARVRALHRRNAYDQKNLLYAADLTLDPLKREVKRAGKTIELTAREFALLELLLRHKNRVVTHTMIAESIWNAQEQFDSNVISVTLYHLRKKIDDGFDLKLIGTVRGSGYRLEAR
jgi:DNA-binding response OmpR family regulator